MAKVLEDMPPEGSQWLMRNGPEHWADQLLPRQSSGKSHVECGRELQQLDLGGSFIASSRYGGTHSLAVNAVAD
ncbi:hypothetical protein POJ06DRAFT_265198 [Lipomyces tetrasporus]|uniref:Uncharacterized protein n=1 Tax=Lipomyces tetrasporus TaxID=54092 RepID=A0AAD7R1W5_9ASCO|nr:uncharacterized protein POJ06DRAFT_265198 [Lipomyces tetrasporus]KAJ8104372.1 hypothetical protein POJ06DRAFT_265198 [Lipomyces tetrasporus]